ncbi:unnamed protein product, partial [Vitis vinifera]
MGSEHSRIHVGRRESEPRTSEVYEEILPGRKGNVSNS